MFGKMADMGKMMGQMKDMKKNLEIVQEEIRKLSEEGGSNGVKVVINGAHVVESINIDDSLLGDKDMLEDLLITACNEANQKVVNKSAEMMSSVTGGINLPF
jgi:DNA-binding YbaB/EbfC family protein